MTSSMRPNKQLLGETRVTTPRPCCKPTSS